jgi:Tfp pilus assembly protein PilV
MSSFYKPQRLYASQAGGVLIEAVFAAVLVAVFLAGSFQMNWKALALLKTSKQQAAATLCLQEREEQLRNLPWLNITDATYLSTTLMSADPVAAAGVPGETETLSIDSYPATSGTATTITRPFGGPTTIVSSNPSLSLNGTVRVNFTISWTGNSGSSHTRQFTTVIANGGITQ